LCTPHQVAVRSIGSQANEWREYPELSFGIDEDIRRRSVQEEIDRGGRNLRGRRNGACNTGKSVSCANTDHAQVPSNKGLDVLIS
jgi:hypothetical protein